MDNILDYLSAEIAQIVNKLEYSLKEEIVEIRLRVNQPLQIITCSNDYFLASNGEKIDNPYKGYIVSKKDIEKSFLILTKNSIYALERQLGEGFITIPGGHRVGFTGQVVVEKGEIKTINNINSLNYRITREKIGIGRGVLKKIYNSNSERIYNTLIISPPLCGKTTLLRDIIRIISQGMLEIGLRGKKVGLIDERSEIGGSYNGVAQNKIGSRTDLLDNCPKAKGMLILIRSMSPEIIAVDEIGSKEDVWAIEEAINSGINLLATVHGDNLETLRLRPSIYCLIKNNVFKRYIILSKKRGIGTIEGVYDSRGKEVV